MLFNKNPFNSSLRISPPNSVSQRDTDKRRVMLDTSFPKWNCVNDVISKEEYSGEKKCNWISQSRRFGSVNQIKRNRLSLV